MENTIQETNILGTEKIGKLLAKFSIPGIVSLVVNALYNIVDQIFIGQGVGYLGNGATNVIFPLTTFAMAFALMIGDGAASFLSLMLGKKENRKAAQGTVAGMIFIVVSGFLIAVIFLAFLKPLCRLFGATDAILPYALDYGRIIALGLPFCAVCAGYASIIRADGSPKYNMIGLLAGCILNLIGDPLFIFVFNMGVKGAALATIIGQIVNAIINFLYIPRIKSVKIEKSDINAGIKTIPSILKLGISSFISQMVLVIVMAVQNNILRTYGELSSYGADIPISALGVTMKVFNILMVIVIGLASGAQPIWGYNYGAGKYKRVQKTLSLVIIISTAVMIVAFAIFQLFPMAVISIFGAEDEMYNQFAIKTLKIFLLLVPISGFQLAAGIFFQAVGRPVNASIISLSKQIIFMIPAMLILAPILGVEGVLWAGPVSDALSFLLTILLFKISWKSIFKEGAALKANTQNESNANTASLAQSKNRYLVNGKPTVITIGRKYGAGGRAIGKKLAERLGIPYYDSSLIQEAAEESGLSAMFLAFADENNLEHGGVSVSSASIYGSGSANGNSGMVRMQKAAEEAQAAVIEKIAANGSCVIVGRRADKILYGKKPLFRVFVSMPLERRTSIVSEREHISEQEAAKLILQVDRQREKYYNLVSPSSWGNIDNYDICIDVEKLGADGAVDIICATLEKL